tara:strand:- start:3154 stop:3387 length:234 start_codon:yes stop_codon:yes gene_type:complete
LFTPAASSLGIGERNVHLNLFAHKSKPTTALGFIGKGSIAGRESHELNKFELADVKGSLVLKVTGLKAAPDQLPISE